MKYALMIAVAVTAACVQPPPPALPDFERLVLTHYVLPLTEGDVERWLSVFTDDAVAMHNRRPADVGKESIRAFAELVASNFDVAEMTAVVDDVQVIGNWAYTRGSYESLFISKDTGEPAPWGRDPGKFLLIWEKQLDGAWKVVLDMGNSNR